MILLHLVNKTFKAQFHIIASEQVKSILPKPPNFHSDLYLTTTINHQSFHHQVRTHFPTHKYHLHRFLPAKVKKKFLV